MGMTFDETWEQRHARELDRPGVGRGSNTAVGADRFDLVATYQDRPAIVNLYTVEKPIGSNQEGRFILRVSDRAEKTQDG